MFEWLTGLPEIEVEAIPERRCAHQQPAPQVDVTKLKDLRCFQMDAHGRLLETLSKSGFRTQYFYVNSHSFELRAYEVLDPNLAIFERAVRARTGHWVIDRLNPAKGKMEIVSKNYEHLSVDKAGNIRRMDKFGNIDTFNVRIASDSLMANVLARPEVCAFS